jgi:hypothetical protein
MLDIQEDSGVGGLRVTGCHYTERIVVTAVFLYQWRRLGSNPSPFEYWLRNGYCKFRYDPLKVCDNGLLFVMKLLRWPPPNIQEITKSKIADPSWDEDHRIHWHETQILHRGEGGTVI